MDFGLSAEQVALQDSINRYLDERAGLERVRAFVAGGDYRGIWRGLADLGVTSLLVPEDQGGLGLGVLDAALVAECLGAHAAPAPFLGSAVVAPLALQYADTALRESWVTKLIDGGTTAGVAFSELAGARGDAGVDAVGGRLSGKAMFVLDPLAELLFVATRDKKLFLVETGAPGLRQRAHTTIDRTRVSGELRFDKTPAQLITDDPDVMLDAAIAYAKERRQFNRVIGSFQAVKHLCAEMVAELEPCRAMMWYAAHTLREFPKEARLTVCHTKAHVAEVGTFVARTATEIHGGIGFTDLLGLHYWFKRIGFNRQALGAPELVREQAAAMQGLSPP